MSNSPGWRRLTVHPDYAAMVERTLTEQAKAVAEVARPTKPVKDRQPQPDNYPKPKGK